jgi:hypothetical protein
MKITTKSHLILHFDINKTLIMSDPVANISIDKMLNSLLSECIYGTVSKNNNSNDVNQINNDNQENVFDNDCRYRVDNWTILNSIPCLLPPHTDAVTFGMYIY